MFSKENMQKIMFFKGKQAKNHVFQTFFKKMMQKQAKK